MSYTPPEIKNYTNTSHATYTISPIYPPLNPYVSSHYLVTNLSLYAPKILHRPSCIKLQNGG
jgi:hypothetical protein